ncbi:MAG: hypothetical protein HOO96_39920 [Polyangiaceae bacterium]|nr:hypothetical protein [Polyangiaceae bacterium]
MGNRLLTLGLSSLLACGHTAESPANTAPTKATAPASAAQPADGIALRFEGLSAQVALPTHRTCVALSQLGSYGPPCEKQIEVPGVRGLATVWINASADGAIVLTFRASARSTPLVEPQPARYTDSAMDAMVRGTNGGLSAMGLELRRVPEKERRLPVGDGSEIALMVLEPVRPPSTPLGEAMAHQVVISIPGKRSIYGLTWATSKARADEIEVMGQKTLETMHFEER